MTPCFIDLSFSLASTLTRLVSTCDKYTQGIPITDLDPNPDTARYKASWLAKRGYITIKTRPQSTRDELFAFFTSKTVIIFSLTGFNTATMMQHYLDHLALEPNQYCIVSSLDEQLYHEALADDEEENDDDTDQ